MSSSADRDEVVLHGVASEALVALCAHVLQHGSMSTDAQYVARELLGIAGAREAARELIGAERLRADDAEKYPSNGANTRERLAEVRAKWERSAW